MKKITDLARLQDEVLAETREKAYQEEQLREEEKKNEKRRKKEEEREENERKNRIRINAQNFLQEDIDRFYTRCLDIIKGEMADSRRKAWISTGSLGYHRDGNWWMSHDSLVMLLTERLRQEGFSVTEIVDAHFVRDYSGWDVGGRWTASFAVTWE